MKKGFFYIITVVVVSGLVFLQREFFPNIKTVETTVLDTATVVQFVKTTDSLKFKCDSLDKQLVESKRIIKRLLTTKPQIHIVNKVDTVIPSNYISLDDCLNTVSNVEYTTVYRDTCKNVITTTLDNTTSVEDFIFYKRSRKHKIRLHSENFVQGDTVKILTGLDDENVIGFYTNISSIPKKLKTNKTNIVHVIGISTNSDIEQRFYTIINF